ncbi:hypothetical protein [Burkholderia sp. BCC0322]|uniref:hypothetical protein n=1 Tax=unclassified Burkholderia TaxID=2613784 RepID=UPI00158DC124|nr:hypothetical protein [Burkholderia sp. BCC0322]
MLSRLLSPIAVLMLAGCAATPSSPPPSASSQGNVSIAISSTVPTSNYLPEQSAIAPGTKYVVVQPGGGSILLGPILGSMNISANTRAMVDEYNGSVFLVDPEPVALEAIRQAGLLVDGKAALYTVEPFVFMQHCDDGRFRLSLVFHAHDNSSPSPWVGRYIYDLPTSYGESQLKSLSSRDLANYRAELSGGAAALSDLMQRDLNGKLPTRGKPVNFGSLYIVGSKLGGMGIYTPPQAIHFSGQLIEETDSYVTVRLDGHMHNTLLGGGLAFGVHRTSRKLVHTLTSAG